MPVESFGTSGAAHNRQEKLAIVIEPTSGDSDVAEGTSEPTTPQSDAKPETSYDRLASLLASQSNKDPAVSNEVLQTSVGDVARRFGVSAAMVSEVLEETVPGSTDSLSDVPDGTQSRSQVSGVQSLTPELRQEILDALLPTIQHYAVDAEDVTQARELLVRLKQEKSVRMYGGSENIFQRAMSRAASEIGLKEDQLKSLVENPDSMSLSSADRPQNALSIVRKLYHIFSTEEEKARLTEMEIDGMTDIGELLESVDVDSEQRDTWRAMLNLDIPKDARIKVVYVSGGKDLDMSGEEQKLQEGLSGLGLTHPPEIVRVDNSTADKSEILRVLEESMKDEKYDIVVPFFSSHGISASSRSVELADVGDANDTFHVVNEPGTQRLYTPQETFMRFGQAEEMLKDQLKSHPKLFDTPDKGAADQADMPSITFKVGPALKITPGMQRDDLVKKVQHRLLIQAYLENSVSTDDLLAVQKKAIQEGTNRKVWYIFDNCYSGSAINDSLATHPSTMSIFASSGEDQVSFQGGKDNTSGSFMDAIFTNMSRGMPPGEAFVRADMKLSFTKGNPYAAHEPGANKIQDPKGTIRRPTGEVIKVSAVDTSVQRGPEVQEQARA